MKSQYSVHDSIYMYLCVWGGEGVMSGLAIIKYSLKKKKALTIKLM